MFELKTTTFTHNMAGYDRVPLIEESDSLANEETPEYGTLETPGTNIQTTKGQGIPQNGIETYSKKSSCFVYILTFFSVLGGFLFGYDTGVVSGALLLVSEEFGLSTVWQELFVSITIGFAAVFALLSHFGNDIFGRKPVIIFASGVFSVGAVVLALAMNKWMLLIGRAILGIGIGLASMTVPMFIAECAPLHLRGRLIVLNNLFITGGQFIASVVDALFSKVLHGWRFMLGLALVPAVIQFVGFFFMPESPRWLVGRGRHEEALCILQRIRGTTEVHEEFECIKQNVAEQNATQTDQAVLVRALKTPTVRKALFVGCMLQVFQQISGINTVMYYSASIIKMAGVHDNSTAIWLAAATASINCIFSLVGLYLVERIGRRPLTLGSLIGTTVSLALLGASFQVAARQSPQVTEHIPVPNGTSSFQCPTYTTCSSCVLDEQCGFCFSTEGGEAVNGSCLAVAQDNKHPQLSDDSHSGYGTCDSKPPADGYTWAHGYCPTSLAWLAFLALLLYLAFFAPGMGPMPWTINSEIYPLWARSLGTSVSAATNWTFNLLVSMTFLSLTQALTRYGAFYLYTSFAFVGCIFVYIFVPETRGVSLEQVEVLFV